MTSSTILQRKGLFEDQSVHGHAFFRANKYPSFFNQICEGLYDMGFRKASVGLRYSISTLNFENPTILFVPNITGSESSSSSLLRIKLLEEFSEIDLVHKQSFATGNKVIRPLNETVLSLKVGNTTFAHWYSARNCLIVYFNIFATNLRIRFALRVLQLIRKQIRQNNITFVSSVEVDQNRAIQNRKAKLREFQNHIHRKIQNIQNKTRTEELEIDNLSKKIILNYRHVVLYKKEAEVLEQFKLEFDKDFETKIKQIEKMQFVKKVEVTSDGIEVDIGQLSIKVRAASREYHTYLGSYKIVIKPDGVSVKNKHSLKKDSNIIQHPHVLGGNCCLGSVSKEINEQIAKYKFKELIFLMYQFLSTYSDEDGGHPYMKIHLWANARLREKKFNPDGSIFTPIKVKKTNPQPPAVSPPAPSAPTSGVRPYAEHRNNITNSSNLTRIHEGELAGEAMLRMNNIANDAIRSTIADPDVLSTRPRRRRTTSRRITRT